jgi:translation initiation factor IF-1
MGDVRRCLRSTGRERFGPPTPREPYVAPTRAHRRGDPWRGSLRRKFSGWYLEVPSRDEYDTDSVVQELLDEVEPYAEALARAREALRLQVGVQVVIEMHSYRDEHGDIIVTTPALSLSAETLRRLADHHLWLDFDQYVY